MYIRRACFGLLLCALLTPAAQADSHKHANLKKKVEKILAQPDLGRGFWGIEITSVKTGKVLCSVNADKMFTPASNTKLFTTAAALAMIGPFPPSFVCFTTSS